ncbi:adenylate/guanylate cyclase domain-containing protein [soil metagenome]
MNCTNCGSDNPAGRRFCDSCGSALAQGCPNCGTQNRPDARFCGNCGTGLNANGPPPPAAQAVQHQGEASERRLVSVLFADLVGFTPFAEERDAEEVRDILSRYFDAARAVIERHGGTVEKFIGDAVMAVWGTPIAREDDAERAVRAALELLPAVRGLDERLQARAGIVTGEAAVSVGATEQGMIAGDLVNTAARLQSVAEPGTVLVGEATMRAAGAAITLEQAGEQELKGKAGRVPAWRALRVVAERGGRARTDTLEPPFVGRESELALLKELLHATTREQRSRLVAVTGPGGIGKSRLAWELEKYVDGLVEVIYWHRGRSPSYGEGIAFWALGEMVRRRCGLAETDDENTTRERVAQTVSEFVPAEEDRLWVEPALLTLLGVEEGPAGGRDVLFAAWRIFFERVSARGTTVLLFEDLQFADSGLLDFIDHLLEWSRNSAILVIGLARPELLERRPGFGSATRHFHSVPLETLSDEQMRQLLAGLVPDLDSGAAASMVARADGIPLYAVETVRMLIADGRLESNQDGACRMLRPLGELAIPDTLRSLIASRLDGLDPADRTLLQHASVVGQSFTLESLVAVSSSSADELSPRLRSLVRRDILAVQADARSPDRGQYQFVQGLIREVAYGTLSRRERRERHLAAARHFEASGDEETAGALASHYLAAYHASERGLQASAVATQARLALRGAAERASALGAYAQAGAHVEQALQVTDDPLERADLLERGARAAEADGRYESGIELARQAIEGYRSAGEQLNAGRASALLGTLLVDSARQGEAAEVLSTVLAQLPEDAHELRAEVGARLSRALMRSNQEPAAVAAADQALAIAEPRAMIGVVAEALVNKAAALSNVGRWREAAALGQAAVALAQEAGANEVHLRALNNLAATLSDDDPPRARRITSEALEVARRLGLRGTVNWLTGTVALGRYWAGSDWAATLSDLTEAVEQTGNEADRGRLLGIAFFMQAARDDARAEILEQVAAISASSDDPVARAATEILRADLALARGELVQAYDAAQRAWTLDPTDPFPPIGMLRAAIWMRDEVRAGSAFVVLDGLPHSGRSSRAGRAWGRAVMAAFEGRGREALAGFRDAVSQLKQLGMEFEAARVGLDALILLPNEPEVRAIAEAGRPTLEDTGAVVYLRRLDAELAGSRSSRAPADRPAGARIPSV